jgi:hypothetical protein
VAIPEAVVHQADAHVRIGGEQIADADEMIFR